MMTEDALRDACRAYLNITGHRPRYLNICPHDFLGVAHLLRNCMDQHGVVHLDPYTLTIRCDGKFIEGQALVTHQAIKANVREVEIPSMTPDPEFPLRARVLPGGASVKYLN